MSWLHHSSSAAAAAPTNITFQSEMLKCGRYFSLLEEKNRVLKLSYHLFRKQEIWINVSFASILASSKQATLTAFFSIFRAKSNRIKICTWWTKCILESHFRGCMFKSRMKESRDWRRIGVKTAGIMTFLYTEASDYSQ